MRILSKNKLQKKREKSNVCAAVIYLLVDISVCWVFSTSEIPFLLFTDDMGLASSVIPSSHWGWGGGLPLSGKHLGCQASPPSEKIGPQLL